jgi:hypothetical protein
MIINTSISGLPETAIITGGYIEISLPDGGGWKSWRISPTNFLSEVNSILAKLTQIKKFKNKSSAFSESFNADTKIESIDFIYVSGTSVSVKVGTSVSANDIISGRTLTSVKNSFNSMSDYLKTASTLYFTITGGAVDIIINYRNNYNS